MPKCLSVCLKSGLIDEWLMLAKFRNTCESIHQTNKSVKSVIILDS